jgi:hypothetical protein
VNVTDFQAPEAPSTWPAILASIFMRQMELMTKYKEIEQLPDPPVPLHHSRGQRILKDFAWRTTEELCESWEAFMKHGVADTAHRDEEMADALHFLVELLIFAGVTSAQCAEELPVYPMLRAEEFPAYSYWAATAQLGIAMNFLRNKPWKQSQVPTDERRFRAQLMVAFTTHCRLWADLGLSQDDMYNLYFRKSEVNKFRQRSNY